MNKRIKIIFIIISIPFYFLTSCSSSKKLIGDKKGYLIYSKDTSRVFNYGLPLSYDNCQMDFINLRNNLEIKNGDKVAEVGAASGWILGALSVFTDSVTYNIQDINTNYLNEKEFKKVVAYFSKLKKTKQTNFFEFTIGDENTTKLHDNYFDKIILHYTYHEIKNKENIILDITKKLKNNGKLFIIENFSNNDIIRKNSGCNLKAQKTQELIDDLSKNNFHIVSLLSPSSSLNNILCFSKNIDDSKKWKLAQDKTNDLIKPLHTLYTSYVNTNAQLCEDVAIKIKTQLENIEITYKGIDDYFLEASKYFEQKKMYLKAINISEANIVVFPNSLRANYQLAYLYFLIKNLNLSLFYHKKCKTFANENKEINDNIEYLNSLLQKEGLKRK